MVGCLNDDFMRAHSVHAVIESQALPPKVAFNLKRNPDYWDKDWALVETVEQPIISEYATALSQLKAGNIYMFGQSGSDEWYATKSVGR